MQKFRVAVIVCVLLSGCKGGGTQPSPPVQTNTITISGNAVSPKNITVARGSQVLFVNSDTRNHDMQSDPHPEHNECPELQQVGFLRPGESRQSGNLNVAKTCGYHDNDMEGNQAMKGSIVIQ